MSNSPPPEDAAEGTDAAITIINDWPEDITVVVDNNQNLVSAFPFTTSTIQSATCTIGYAQAAPSPTAQPSFDVSFQSGNKMTVNLGVAPFATSAAPPSFPDQKAGAVLAPVKMGGSPIDYNFLFFDGPGVLPIAINAFIQSHLPAIVSHIATSATAIPVAGGSSFHITDLKIDPASLTCPYAGMLPENQYSQTAVINSIFLVKEATLIGTQTIASQTGTFDLTIKDLTMYIQFKVDSSFSEIPRATALQCSLGDFSLSGTLRTVLESVIGEEGVAFIFASPYNLAAFVNTVQNETVMETLNAALKANAAKLPGWITEALGVSDEEQQTAS
ncbi:hypothetical protein B0H63DRAFT_487285 [Podospora didyma]|uniref:Uncharacterized protein n=1 Tax=Podospora didyma TaxID=330526 RepID=A0AAE0K6N4_9PEZI|nr:hypothetical protein B0H63DRAFT_487285 [Podospora didyma]